MAPQYFQKLTQEQASCHNLKVISYFGIVRYLEMHTTELDHTAKYCKWSRKGDAISS